MESQWLIYIINFVKTTNHFNHFLSIFAFLVHSMLHGIKMMDASGKVQIALKFLEVFTKVTYDVMNALWF